jgi:hypothetical protein|tara:strand:- start:2010 stop:2558 length:549 start_codon:yes stop_codon:yes gene_type:complete
MPTPSSRTPVRIARGTYSNLNSSIADIQEGEICYATDQDKLYVKEGSSLVSTQANVDPDTAVTDAAQTFTAAQRGAISAISVASGDTTKQLDFATANNFAVTLANSASCELQNPSNLTAGQSGSIFVIQSSAGSHLLTYGSSWDFAGGAAPSLSTAGDSIDRIDYIVRSGTSIHAVFTAAYS